MSEYQRRWVDDGATEEQYYAAKAKLELIQARLEACPGFLTMRALPLRKVGMWQRYKARLNAILEVLEPFVEENTCSCGEYRWDCSQGRKVAF